MWLGAHLIARPYLIVSHSLSSIRKTLDKTLSGYQSYVIGGTYIFFVRAI